MDFIQSRTLFINALLSHPRAKMHSGGTKISLPCPICGDTKENHFHIHVPSSNEELIYYKCFRSVCNAKGLLNSSILRDLDITSPDVINFVKILNGNLKTSNSKRYNRFSGYKIFNLAPRKTDEYINKKISYINNRLGLELSAKEITSMKIVLSFSDLLHYNKLNLSENFSEKRAWYIEYNTVGFISRDGSHCTFRDIDKKSYVAYNLLGEDECDKYYTIPCELDFMRHINVYIAEGPFDILSAYYNLDLDKDNALFIATCGASSYESILKSLIRIGVFNCTFNIFSDKDVTIEQYVAIKNKIGNYKFIRPINIFYNKIGKDIGVRKEEIELLQTQI